MSVVSPSIVEHTDRGPLGRDEMARVLAGDIPAGRTSTSA